jgi:hypothetical protein
MLPEPLAGWLGALQGWLFQALVLPVIQWAGLTMYTEDAFNGTEDDPAWNRDPCGGAATLERLSADRFVRPLGRATHRPHRAFPLAFFFTCARCSTPAGWLPHGVPTPNPRRCTPGRVCSLVVRLRHWIHRHKQWW